MGVGLIRKVRLRNWKTHADSELEFGKGTNVLVGAMGSGKTSIMEGICFALFGTFPALQARRVSLEEVIQNKPNQAEEAAVELEFDYGGKGYKVERVIKRKGSNEAKLYCGGKIVAGPKPKDATAAVERAIEINYNLFSRAVYSEQNEMDYFLRLSPRDRKQKFDELLDLRKYETVRANAVTVANRLKGIAKDKRQWLQEQRAGLKPEEEKGLQKRVAEKEKESRELEKAIEERGKEVAELEKEVARLEKKEKEFEFLRDLLIKSRARIQEMEKAIEETRKEAKGKAKQELEKEEKGLGEKLKGKEKEIEKLDAEEKKLQGERREWEKRAAIAAGKVKELKEHLEQLRGLKAVCPVCRKKLEAKTREQLIAENEGEQEKRAAEKESREKRARELGEKLEAIGERDRKIGLEREKLREQGIDLKHLKGRLALLAEKEKGLKALREEAAKVQKQAKETGFDEKKLQEKRKALVEGRAAIEGSRKGIEANREIVKEIGERLGKMEKAREQVKEIGEKVEQVERAAEKVGLFTNALQATQSELRLGLVSGINQAMESIWPNIYPYRDFVSAKMHIEAGSYELKARTRGGEWVRVEGILSGGERSAAAICIRIAFSLVLTQNLSWLILDEPTHNLDSSAVGKLSKMMQEQLPQMVDQVFVITHDSEMKKAASAALYELERNKDEEGVTRPVAVPVQA